jgi:hypothetical protein
MGLSENDITSSSLKPNTIPTNNDSLSIQVNSSILNLIRINNLIDNETTTNNLKFSTSQSNLKDSNESDDRSMLILNYQNSNNGTDLNANGSSSIISSESSSMDSSYSTDSTHDNPNDNYNKRGS